MAAPQIMVYFNQRAYTPRSKAETEQWGKVLEFQESFPKEGLWWPYNGKAEFERLVRGHLTNWLRQRATLSPPPPEPERALSGGLPPQFTRFFGRENELRQIEEMLRSGTTRLLTLTGPAGTGKTRVAIEAAGRLVEPLAGAVWFAPLAELSDPDLLPGVLLDALHLPRSSVAEPLEQVTAELSRQPSLLVLDGFDPLVESGGAEIAQTLRERVPALTILVTSRRLLGLSGERAFEVPPLPTPSGGAESSLGAYESVRLFVDRAQAVKPDFEVNNQNAPAVAELCDRLEGIPLAIELAAARAQVLTPAEMLEQLARRFEFLVGRRRGVAERLRTLRAAVDWSFRLLSPELQRFFARLSVFRGGWTAEAAKVICDEPLALDYLAELRECSFVRTEETGEEMRFRLLETLREYGASQLASEERTEVEQRHVQHFLALAERAEPNLTGPEQGERLQRLHADHENLRAALALAIEREDEETGLRLCGALWYYWSLRSHLTEGRRSLEAILARVPVNHPTLGRSALRARALLGAGALAHDQSDYASAADHLEESIALWREIGDERGLAGALNVRGNVALDQGDPERARPLYEEALALYGNLGDHRGASIVLSNLGVLAEDEGDLDRASELLRESVRLKRRLGNRYGLANSLDSLGNVEQSRGELADAAALYEEALALRREIGHRQGVAMSLNNLGYARLASGDLAGAKSHLIESLALFAELREMRGLCECLAGLAGVASAEGRHDPAARLYGAVQALREEHGVPIPASVRESEERLLVPSRAALGEQAFASAAAKGSEMSLEAALACAREEER